MAWFRSSSLNLPERDFAPADLALPFRLPVIAIGDDGSVSAHREPDGLVLVSERQLASGRVPGMQIVGDDFRTWRPVKILAVSHAHRKLLGQRLFFAEFQYTEDPPSDLEALRQALCSAIEHDPDDLWNQVTSPEALIEHAIRAGTFSEMVSVIIDLGGRGS